MIVCDELSDTVYCLEKCAALLPASSYLRLFTWEGRCGRRCFRRHKTQKRTFRYLTPWLGKKYLRSVALKSFCLHRSRTAVSFCAPICCR